MPRPVKETPNNARSKGLRATLLYLKPETVMDLKTAAMKEGKNAYEIAERAIVDYLAKHKPRR